MGAVKTAGGSTAGIDIYSEEKAGHGLSELLHRKDVGAVVIALPIPVQPDVVIKSLEAGKHVLCEKPIAKDVSTGARILIDYEETYAAPNRVFSVAEQMRYDRGFAKARDIVASGEIGDVSHVHCRVMWSMGSKNKYYETPWRQDPEYQGGFILDAGVHFVAIARTVSGQEIVETRGMASQHWPHLPPTDTVNSALRFSGGATGSLSLSCASTKSLFEFLFIGSKGSLTINSVDDKAKLIVEDAETKKQREEVVEGHAMYEELKAFLQAAETGIPDIYGSPREALADVAVIESICAGGGFISQPSL